MTFYEILVLIHIFSAILGMGPGFVMTPIAKKASNMTELKHAYAIRNKLHQFVMIGGTLLLITGIWMGFLNTYLLQQGWYITSLILYLIALAAGPTVLVSSSKPIKALLKQHKGEDIPSEYFTLSKKLFFYEYLINTMFLIIIALMITKPF
ncbi:DUF2269 domain-containing protein [Oceanobacillus sp. J11TS1]|uniref:DUF2269 domain-containing protein n=1 Tax=Oceanobacillus sp. J11TS1 TaxID=2807191 RepID=UPI001B0A0877|nr:DUF2269 domain-containing protein [Oceanobacillus sp. J11TS1]GIO22138.1 hypothetical protein J11TS1_07190 [Oceanobacillus sp. J11TS1]